MGDGLINDLIVQSSEGAKGGLDLSSNGISLIIPAYNEEDRIAKSLDSYIPVLKSLGVPFEVLVIIDGSDGTYDTIQAYSGLGVTGHRFNSKLGKGGAIRKGISLAIYDVICWVDADGSLFPDDLKKILEATEHYDCVVASRWLRDSVWVTKEPLFNRTVGRVFNVLVRGMLGLPVMDTQCGAKAFRSSVARSVMATTVVNNRTFDVAMLYHARRSGATMKEIGVRWEHDPRTRMPIFRVIPIMFLTLVGIRLMNLPIRKYFPEEIVNYFVSRYASD